MARHAARVALDSSRATAAASRGCGRVARDQRRRRETRQRWCASAAMPVFALRNQGATTAPHHVGSAEARRELESMRCVANVFRSSRNRACLSPAMIVGPWTARLTGSRVERTWPGRQPLRRGRRLPGRSPLHRRRRRAARRPPSPRRSRRGAPPPRTARSNSRWQPTALPLRSAQRPPYALICSRETNGTAPAFFLYGPILPRRAKLRHSSSRTLQHC